MSYNSLVNMLHDTRYMKKVNFTILGVYRSVWTPAMEPIILIQLKKSLYNEIKFLFMFLETSDHGELNKLVR